MTESDEEFQGVEWTLENISCWNGDVHHGKVLRSRQFYYGRWNHTLELYPRGIDGHGEHLVVRLLELNSYARYPLFSGSLSFIASDGSQICSQGINATGSNLTICSSGPKFKEVVARNRKSEHQDRLTLRLRLHKYGAVIHMCTTIDVYDTSIRISPDAYKDLETEKFTEISSIEFPFDNGNWKCLSFQVEKYDSLAIVSQEELYPTLVLARTSVLNRDGDVVRTEDNEHLFQKVRRWEFPYPLTVEERGFSLFLHVRIVPCNEFKHQRRLFSRPKKGVNVTSSILLNQDRSVTFGESSEDKPEAAVSNRVDNSMEELAKDFKCLYQDQDYSDIELKCGDVTFPVHRNILSARSPVFKTMLSADMKEAASGSVDVEDMDAETLSHFLTYLYTGTVEDLQCDSALKLFYAADKYQVPSLKRECSDILRDNVTLSNVCDVLSLANRHEDGDLTSAAHDFILENFNRVLGSEEWKGFSKSESLFAVQTLTHLAQKKCAGKLSTT